MNVRFGAKPSVFKYPDDDDYLAGAVIALTPRPKDHGGLSLWRFETDSERARVVAAFASGRPRIDAAKMLCMADELFSCCDVELHDTPAVDAQPCIAGQHREAGLSDLDLCQNLALEIQRRLREKDPSVVHESMSKTAGQLVL